MKGKVKFKMKRKTRGGRTKNYEYDGIPVPLIINAREYGSSSGEKKKPFLRKSFNKNEIQNAMLKVQEKYIKEN